MSILRTALSAAIPLILAVSASWVKAQDYSDLDTPQEMPPSWIGLYAPRLIDCSNDNVLSKVYIERRGLHFYEAAALAQRIVWVDQDIELFMYGLLGGEGTVGSATYRIKRAGDGKSITFFGGASATDDNAKGEVLSRCPNP